MAIPQMSRTLLSQSTVSNGFPKEATFQHLLMTSIAASTPATCSICPELSNVFPTSCNLLNGRIQGEVDFYLNGSLRWGIELLVQGQGIGEHIAQFDSKGKYHALDVRDYVVLDFRRGQVSNIRRHANCLSVFFPSESFESCQFVYGNDDPVMLALST